MCEGQVVRVDLDLGHHRRHVLVDAPCPEVVAQVLLEHVADCPLGVGPAIVERHLVQLVARQFRAAEDEPDLRPVAVGDGNVPAVLDQRSDVLIGLPRGLVLVLDGLMWGVGNQ